MALFITVMYVLFLQVIPLSQVSGLLEWCEGTIPMGEYLIGSNAAHVRYRPTDYKAIQCRQLMNKAHSGDGNKAKVWASFIISSQRSN